MMNLDKCDDYFRNLLGSSVKLPGEYDITCRTDLDINHIGYATNLTPDVVNAAIDRKVDLIVTHHDAWDFVYGMGFICREKMMEHSIAHIFIHTPLDAAEFGTAATFGRLLGGKVVGTMAKIHNFPCGRVFELDEALPLEKVQKKIEHVCGEKVRSWKNKDDEVKRFGIVTGAGALTSFLKETSENQCSLYITGEKNLYTIQFAQFSGINLIVGSHTFTEIFGVKSLVEILKEEFPHIEISRINEEHLELPD